MKSVLRTGIIGMIVLCGLNFLLLIATFVDTESIERLPSNACIKNFGKIVFSYDPRDNVAVNYGIYLMDPDGSNRVRLSNPDAKNDTMPSWSPDRCNIAFVRFSREGRNDIYVMSVDGKKIRRLTSDPGQDIFPDWSPDGKRFRLYPIEMDFVIYL